MEFIPGQYEAGVLAANRKFLSTLRSKDPIVATIFKEADSTRDWMLDARSRARTALGKSKNKEHDALTSNLCDASDGFATTPYHESTQNSGLYQACLLCGAARTKEHLEYGLRKFKAEYALIKKT